MRAARLSRFANEAKVAPEFRFYCVNERCARLFAVNTAEVKRRVKPFVTCPFCATKACVVCQIRWHDALTCDEIKVKKDRHINISVYTRVVRATLRVPNYSTSSHRLHWLA